METIFMNTSNSKTNESNEFIYRFTDKLNLKNPSKNMALPNLSIYYTWKNIKPEYSNNKFKISAPIWNDVGAELLICLMDLIQLLIFKIILSILLKNIKLSRTPLQY